MSCAGVWLEKGHHISSFDVQSGYHHFLFHPDMRVYFIFHYKGRYYRSIAIPFGLGMSGSWFTNFMRPFLE